MALAFVKSDTNINFIGKRKLAFAFSILLLVVGLLSISVGGGLKLGIDFAGGLVMQIQFERDVDDETLKKSLDKPELPAISTQRFGDGGRDYLLRVSMAEQRGADSTSLRPAVENTLRENFAGNAVTVQRVEMVGPKVGDDLTNKALNALYYAILLIAVYISGRFEQKWLVAALMAACLWGAMYVLSTYVALGIGWLVLAALLVTLVICFFLKLNFAIGAIVALIHDVGITVGILSLLGVEVDLNIIAALLTLIGYSLNDTIIIFDRLRENLRLGTLPDMASLINRSVNQTLSRTILTSGTTLLASLALYFFGGGVIHDFAMCMTIGVFVGTYSSIYIASALLMVLGDMAFYRKAQEQEDYERPGEHGMV